MITDRDRRDFRMIILFVMPAFAALFTLIWSATA